MLKTILAAWERSPLRRRYDGLTQRERLLVLGCVAAVAVLAVYTAGGPLIEFHEQAVARYETGEEGLNWMRAYRAKAESRLDDADVGSQALLSTINTVAKEFNLTLRRIQPAAGGYSLLIEAQPFDDVIRWSHTLATRHGIEIVNVSVDRQEPGTVNARFTVR